MNVPFSGMVGLLIGALAINADAQSLITRLPVDGTWATYDIVGNESRTGAISDEFKGTITIRSVGEDVSQDQGMEQLRWIEVEQKVLVGGLPVNAIHKLLIPESEIGEGKDPMSKIEKLWSWQSQYGKRDPELIDPDSSKVGLPRVIFSPPFEDSAEIEPRMFVMPFGEVQCSGWSGECDNTFGESKMRIHRVVEYWSHEKSPFGPIQLKVELNFTPGTVTNATMTLKEIGSGATSAWPNNN